MAQTKRKRKRKHRGTPAGTIERAARTGRTQTREDAKEIARKRRAERLNRPPSWRSAITRAAIAALAFAVLVAVILGEKPGYAARLAVLMFLLYIPIGYATDSAIYRFRQRRRR